MSAVTTPDGGAAVTMSSLELVEFINRNRADGDTELRHDNFMAKVPKVLGIAAPAFLGTVRRVQPTGGFREYPCYHFPKREACLMAMSYSYELQAKVFDRMTQLETAQAAPLVIPTTLPDALRLAADLAEQRAAAEAKLAVVEPKAAAFDRIATGADGSYCLTDAAKLLQVPPRKLISKLQQAGWIYRRPMGSGWLGYQDRIATGLLEHKVTSGDRADGSEWTSTQVRITAKGLTRLAQMVTAEGTAA